MVKAKIPELVKHYPNTVKWSYNFQDDEFQARFAGGFLVICFPMSNCKHRRGNCQCKVDKITFGWEIFEGGTKRHIKHSVEHSTLYKAKSSALKVLNRLLTERHKDSIDNFYSDKFLTW